MISFHNVSRNYSLNGESIITPVHDLNLTVNPGEFVLILGRSGSGKTSLLNLAAGLIKPSAGKVYIKDQDIGTLTDKKLSSLRAKTIGFVFQFPSLVPSLNVLENTSLPVSFCLKEEKRANCNRASFLLNKVGLGERMGVFPKQLSAGEQKRAVLARALINNPEILLADEPTSDLDERTEQEIMSLLQDLHAGGTTILMVTHSTELIGYANRTMEMKEGNLASFGSTG